MLNSERFTKLIYYQTKSLEGKVQRAIRKIKGKLTQQAYRKKYPTRSSQGKVYDTAIRHKLHANGTVDDLAIQPIISNLGTASYQLAKNLAKLLKPLTQSEYTLNSTVDFIHKIKKSF